MKSIILFIFTILFSVVWMGLTLLLAYSLWKNIEINYLKVIGTILLFIFLDTITSVINRDE